MLFRSGATAAKPDPEVRTQTKTITTVPDSCDAALTAAAGALEANIRWREAAANAMLAAADGFGAISNLNVTALEESAGRMSAQQPFMSDAQDDINTYTPQFLAQAEACRDA